MNTRERFLATMDFEQVDRGISWEIGYWAGAVRRWYKEGLPKVKGCPDNIGDGNSVHAQASTADPDTLNPIDHPRRDADLANFFCMDEPWWRIPVNTYLCPRFAPEILEEYGNTMVHRNEFGVIVKDQKDKNGFPHWIETPVKNMDDWEKLKAQRLRPTLEGRLPANWEQVKQAFKDRPFVSVAGGYPCGFYGTARFLLGEERVMTMFYDEPELMRDIVNYLADFWVALYDQVLDDVSADALFIWEDMCYKGGPLISPAMFREFLLPGYQKMSACARDHGVRHVIVDTDGNCSALLPLFIEGGVTVLHPFEAASDMDVVEVRKAFPKLGIMGGIDKREIAKGRAAIDAELARQVLYMMSQGGYIPTIDHSVPPDISWEDYRYYRSKLNEMIGVLGQP